MIRKYYGRSTVALLLIPVAARAGAFIFDAIDPEVARGRADYVRHFALLQHVRSGLWLASLALVGALWLLAFIWLLRAKAQSRSWLPLALFGAPGFAVLAALPDHSPPAPADAYRRQLERLPRLLRVLYEILRFAAFGFVAMQLVDWINAGSATLEATRRGLTVAQVLAERDASSGMWAFGDMIRAAYAFVLIYALWPAGFNLLTGMVRRLRLGGAAAGH